MPSDDATRLDPDDASLWVQRYPYLLKALENATADRASERRVKKELFALVRDLIAEDRAASATKR